MSHVDEGKISVLGTGNAGVVLDSAIVKQVDGTRAYREGVVVSDPETTVARQKVVGADPRPIDFGAVVHDPASVANTTLLLAVLAELRVVSTLLQRGLNVREDIEGLRRDSERDIVGKVQ